MLKIYKFNITSNISSILNTYYSRLYNINSIITIQKNMERL